MPVEDFIYPRNPSAGTVTATSRADWTGTQGTDGSNTIRLGRAEHGFPERMPGQWTTEIVKTGGKRPELVEWPPNWQGYIDRHGPGKQRWFGWSMWWPTNQPSVSGSSTWQVLWQMHSGELSDGSSPNLSPTSVLEARNGRLEFLHRWGGGSSSWGAIWDPVPKGIWIDFLLFIHFTRTSQPNSKILLTRLAQSGQVPAWQKTFTFSGITMMPESIGHIQEGQYSSTFPALTLYRGPKRYRGTREWIESGLWGGGSTEPPAAFPVSNLTATPGDGQVALSWTNPGVRDEIIVRRSTGSYPASPTSGTAVYSGTGTSVTNAGLTNGTTYFYRVWARVGTAFSDPVGITATPAVTPAPQPGSCTSSPPVVEGANLVGTVTWAAAVTPPTGATVTSVVFQVDSVTQFTELNAPYSRAFDTTALSDGAHLFAVEAFFSNSTSAEDGFTAFVDNAPVPSNPPTAPTSVSATLDDPNDGIDWSVTLPADTSRSSLEVAAFPRPIGTDDWNHPDAIELYSASVATTASTPTGSLDGLPAGTYYVRAWTVGPGGSSFANAPATVEVGGVDPGTGRTYFTRTLTGPEGSPLGTPWEVRQVNQGTSAGAVYLAGGGAALTTQSANGASSRIVAEIMEDVSVDFANGADDVRVAHVGFTVPTGAADFALYLIPSADTGVTDPFLALDDWVRVRLDMRPAVKLVALEKKDAGVNSTVASVNLGTQQFPGSSAFLQLALDRTHVQAAYLFDQQGVTLGDAVAHGLSIDVASLRLLLVAFQTSTVASTTNVRTVKLMRHVPNPPVSAAVALKKANGSVWLSGVDAPVLLDRIELSGVFPDPDPAQPNEYRGRLAGQTVGKSPTRLDNDPIEFAPVPPSETPYEALLDAGNESVI